MRPLELLLDKQGKDNTLKFPVHRPTPSFEHEWVEIFQQAGKYLADATDLTGL
jgi:hypothetical protein